MYTTGNADVLKKRGMIALEDGEWEKADSFFEEVLNQDAECAEAYLGKLLAKCGCSSLDELFDYYANLYSVNRFQYLEACPEDEAHIAWAMKEYAVEGFLEDYDIGAEFGFDNTYKSTVSCREKQKEQIAAELASERLLVRAQQYAKGELKDSIDRGISLIYKTYEDRLATAKENDAAEKARVVAEYNALIADLDAKLPKMKEAALAEKEKAERIAEEERQLSEFKRKKDKARNKKIVIIVACVVAIAATIGTVYETVIIPRQKEKAALEAARLAEERKETIVKSLTSYVYEHNYSLNSNSYKYKATLTFHEDETFKWYWEEISSSGNDVHEPRTVYGTWRMVILDLDNNKIYVNLITNSSKEMDFGPMIQDEIYTTSYSADIDENNEIRRLYVSGYSGFASFWRVE